MMMNLGETLRLSNEFLHGALLIGLNSQGSLIREDGNPQSRSRASPRSFNLSFRQPPRPLPVHSLSTFCRVHEHHGKKLIYFNCIQFTFPFYYFQVPRREFLAATNARKESGAPSETLKRFPFSVSSASTSFPATRPSLAVRFVNDESSECF